ncbi:GntR family transcriptional regulator [Flagellimonas sp.]|uniref:GntR family transcriptional regulator n=1 Tax=Flagellimonas sp. TaxID=2058762 RepID=UPI003F4A0A77
MIQPRILRDKVKSHLLEQIQQGKLQIGKTINLAAVARETGISVTPVREALSQLEHARIVQAIPNRGFIIRPLGTLEARHLYETVSQLEVMALENTPFTEEYIQELRNYFMNMETKNSITARFEFHKLLLHNCANPILLQILDDLKARLYFYEQILPESAVIDHQMETQNDAILNAIEENNIPTAALILKMHWMTVLERVQNQFTTD